jgi:adenylate cyclase
MSDVFVSYARPDESHAQRIAEALRAEGYVVWRDDELPAHRAYADVIEERLKAAGAVVVLWSADAAKSQWVRAEADAARSAGNLIQASLDGIVPPLPFNQIQCADLNGWSEETDSPGWRKLIASVRALAPKVVAESSTRTRRQQVCD